MHVVIIGAGIIGLACAHAFVRQGIRTTIIDRDPGGDKASLGNAGGLAVTEVVPASMPGLLWKVPRWLLDPLGPLSLDWRSLPAMAPWLVRFAQVSRPRETARLCNALAALHAPAVDDTRALLHAIGLGHDLHERGALAVYESIRGFAADAREWALRRAFGVTCHELSGDEARAMEPALGPLVLRAVFMPQWAHVSDPRRIVDGLRHWVVSHGAALVAGEVAAIDPSGHLRLRNGSVLAFDRVIVAAGAWSGVLSRPLGDRTLLASERGYNTTIAAPGIRLDREIIFAERKFVATPLSCGLRIGGAAEFAHADAPANDARARVLLGLARRYLPGVQGEGTPWMGVRPTTPDSLPVIGRSPRHRNVFYAFGHGHYGLTHAATTARLLHALVTDRPASVPLAPYSIGRFSKRGTVD